MPKVTPEISIVILQYHSVAQTLGLLRQIKEQVTLPYEVIVVDHEQSKLLSKKINKMFPSVLYKPHANLGYGAGNNYGAEQTSGRYLLFINPDVELISNAVETLKIFLDKHPEVGAVAPLLLNSTGLPFQYQGARKLTPLRALFSLTFLHALLPNNFIARKYYALDLDRKKTMYLDAIPGSVFLIRRSTFNNACMFDPRMFMFFEEHDLGNRIRALGQLLCIFPSAKAIHHHTVASSSKLKKYFKESRKYYFQKYYGSTISWLMELVL